MDIRLGNEQENNTTQSRFGVQESINTSPLNPILSINNSSTSVLDSDSVRSETVSNKDHERNDEDINNGENRKLLLGVSSKNRDVPNHEGREVYRHAGADRVAL